MAEYISRNAVITTIKNYGKGAIAEGVKTLDPVDDIVALAEAIKWLQIADVAPVVHGRWKETDLVELQGTTSETMRIPNAGLRCSVCAHAFDKKLLWKDNYCPNCGAKMNGGTNEPV